MPQTRREIAEAFGVNKQTVTNVIKRLGLENHVRRVGQYDVIDDEGVSAVADALSKTIPQRGAAPAKAAPGPVDGLVESMAARIADLKEQLAEERARHEREVDALRDQLADANARADRLSRQLAAMAERQQAISAAPWWRRGAVARRLLGPGE